jgi:two-component system invasion response regulator UvrY
VIRVLIADDHMHPEDHCRMRVLKAGAAGYVMKVSTPEELIKAIRKVLCGGRYVTPALAEKLAVNLRGHTEYAAHEALFGREFEIFRMIGSGKTVGQIAVELHLGITTVSTYRARILEKMNIATNAISSVMHCTTIWSIETTSSAIDELCRANHDNRRLTSSTQISHSAL